MTTTSPVLAWWDRAPSALRWTIGLVYAFGTTGLLFALVAWLGPSDWSTTSVLFVAGLVSLAFTPLGISAQARRLGGWRQWNLYRRAYKSGVVPPDAALDRWRPIARRNLRFFREGRTLYRVVIGVLLVLSLIPGIVLVVAEGLVGLSAIAFTAVFAVIAWVTDRLYRRRDRQFEKFVAAIDEADTAAAA